MCAVILNAGPFITGAGATAGAPTATGAPIATFLPVTLLTFIATAGAITTGTATGAVGAFPFFMR